MRKYDTLTSPAYHKGSAQFKAFFGSLKKSLKKPNDYASKLGIVGWAVFFTIAFFFIIFMANKFSGPEVKFTSETVANVVRLRDGAEASMDFVMLWTLFFFLLSVINDLWSMDYSQGPIKN